MKIFDASAKLSSGVSLFDASAKLSSGVSLDDMLMVGLTIHSSLIFILL